MAGRRQQLLGIARGGGLNLAGAGFNQVVRFGITFILARVLGRTQSGLYFQAFAILSLLAIFSSFGFTQSLTRFVAVHRADGDAGALRGTLRLALAIATGSATILGIALFASAPWLAHDVFHDPRLTQLLRVAAVALPATVFTDCALSATQGFKTMRPSARIGLFFEPSMNVVLTGSALALGLGLTGAMVALLVTNLTASILAALALRRLTGRPSDPPAYHPRELLTFSAVSWGSQLGATGLLWADTILLGILRGPSDVGLYQVATRLTLLVTTVIAPIGNAFAPRIADLYRRGEHEMLHRAYTAVTSWIFRLALPAAVMLIVFARPLLALFGPEFVAGAQVTVVLTLGQLINASTGPCGLMLVMSGRPSIQMVANAFTLALNVGLNLYLIPRYGVVGAASAWAVSIATINIVRVVAVWVTLHMLPLELALAKGCAAAVVAFGSALLVRHFVVGPGEIIVGAAVIAITYFLTLVALGIDPEDRAILATLARTLRHRGGPRVRRAES